MCASRRPHRLLSMRLTCLVLGCVIVIPVAASAQALPPSGQLHFSDFGLRLLQTLASSDTSNVFISPLSAGLAYSALLPGAAGQTAKEISTTLGLSAGGDSGQRHLSELLNQITRSADITLRIGTSLWLQTLFPVKPSYSGALVRQYKAEVRRIDFRQESASEELDKWASRVSEGRIPALHIPTTELRVLLLNAVYFKGDWSEAFDSSRTKADTFQLASGRTTVLPFMSTSRPLRLWQSDTLQAVLIPYKGLSLSALIILPRLGHQVSEVLPSLTAARIRGWLSAPFAGVALRLPRLQIRGDYDLIPPMKRLGIRAAFDPDTADFSALSPTPLYVGMSRQVTYLNVDEKGTTAVAITSNGLVPRGERDPDIHVNVDRPFVFGIVANQTGELIFIGQIADPRPVPAE